MGEFHVVPKLMLPKTYAKSKHDVSKYTPSEKLDGIRAFYDHKKGKMFSRSGREINVPGNFTKHFPNKNLDGELYLGKGMNNFSKLTGLYNTKNTTPKDWKRVKYVVFDLPSSNKGYDDRMKDLKSLVNNSQGSKLRIVKIYKPLNSHEELQKKLKVIEKGGGEGLILVKTDSKYDGKRTSNSLKVKSFKDDEAELVGYNYKKTPSKSHLIKSFKMQMKNGKKFNLGGFKKSMEKNPPPIGSSITYTYFESTTNGLPRFPKFKGVRTDLLKEGE